MSGNEDNTGKPPRLQRELKRNRETARLNREFKRQGMDRIDRTNPPQRLDMEFMSQAPPRRLTNELQSQAAPQRLTNELQSQAPPRRLANELQSQAAPQRLTNELQSQAAPQRLTNELLSQAAPLRLTNELESQSMSLDGLVKDIPDVDDDDDDDLYDVMDELIEENYLDEYLDLTGKMDATDWTPPVLPFEAKCLQEEDMPHLTFHRSVYGCLPINWMPAIRESRMDDGSLTKFRRIMFQDDVAVTDAVLESWYCHVKTEFHHSLLQSINLQGCRFLTDWGIHWLALLLEGKTGLTKIKLDGCSEVTERGLLELCTSGPILEVSCNNTSIASLPDMITKQNPHHKVLRKHFPLAQKPDSEKKIFGPYNKVLIHPSKLCSASVLDVVRNATLTSDTTASVVVDVEMKPTERLLTEHSDNPLMMNVLQISEEDSCFGLMTSEAPQQVVVPFDDVQDMEKVANMVTDVIKQNAAKEKPTVSSGLKEVKVTVPPCLWSLQAVQEFLIDFQSGIVELKTHKDIGVCQLMFGEQMSTYFNRLELQVLECDSAEASMHCQLMRISPYNESKMKPMNIKTGDKIVLEYLPDASILLKQNEMTVETHKAFDCGFPILGVQNPNFNMTLKVVNLNCLMPGDPPQFFLKENFHIQDYLFDYSTGILRCDNSSKSTFAFRGNRGLFKAVQPFSPDKNMVSIKVLELGKQGNISFGVSCNGKHERSSLTNAWTSECVYFQLGQKNMVVSNSSRTDTEALTTELDVGRGDVLRIEVVGLKDVYVEAEDKLTVKFYQNHTQFHELTWDCNTSGMIYPSIAMMDTDECIQILDYKDPKPLHQRMADTLNETVLVCGQRKCSLSDGVIESGPNCQDTSERKEYFMAANSLCLYSSYFEITIKQVDEESIFSLGLVHASHPKSKSPGNAYGTVGWLFDRKRNYVHASLKRMVRGSKKNAKTAVQAANTVLGCGFNTENLLWDEYGLPVPFQDLHMYFSVNGEKMHEAIFKYLGGGLFPYIQMGQPGVKIQINQLYSKSWTSVKMEAKEIPVSPGMQYIMAAVRTRDGIKDWTSKIQTLEGSIQKKLQKHVQDLKKEKLKLWNRSKVCFADHQAVSVLSRAEYTLNSLLNQWKTRTSFVTVDTTNLPKGMSQLSEVLGRNIECSVLHHPHLYYYTEEVHSVLDKLSKLKEDKIFTLQQVMEMFKRDDQPSQAALVKMCLVRLQQWGKILLFPDQDPTLVVTNPEWFVKILSLLPREPTTSSPEALLHCVSKGTPLWTPKQSLTVLKEKLSQNQKTAKLYESTTENLSREKIVLLLQVLVESGLLMRLKPHRNAPTDPRYYLTQPSTLGALPSEAVLKKYYDPLKQQLDDKIVRARKVYTLALEAMAPHVWYGIVAGVAEFCEPKLLWDQGIVWHQGPVECVLLAEKSEKGISSLMFEAKTYSVDVGTTSVAPRSKAILQSVFRIYMDIMDAILSKQHVVVQGALHNVEEYDDTAICAVHQWEKPVGQSGVSVCTLCNNCCGEGLRCEYNGILSDKPLLCLCETENNCCNHCGLCRKCAAKLWTYRSELRPGGLLMLEPSSKDVKPRSGVSDISISRVSNFPIDTAVCSEFYIRVPERTSDDPSSPSWGLLSEDGDEFCVCVSSRILLDCPDVVYTYPVNNSNLSFFTTVSGYKAESHAVYTLKLSDVKIPQKDDDMDSVHKYNFSAMAGVNFYDETGIVECEWNNWTESKVTGYIVSKLPLSTQSFYYEAEIMSIGGEAGFVGIGVIPLENDSKFGRMKYGFQASVGNTLMGELEEQKEMGVLSAVKVGDKLGVGVIYNRHDEPNQIFFTVNGKRQKLSVSSSKELSAHVVVQDHGWKVRLTTRGVWRSHPDDLHEAVDALVEKEKATQDWGKHDTLDISPQSLLKFQLAPRIPGQEDEIHAQIVLKSSPDKQHLIIYKVDISNFKRYQVKPMKGILSPGDIVLIDVIGKCDETEDISYDKFRLEWKVDVMGLSVKKYGTEYTGFGKKRDEDGPFSVFDNKWTVAWNDPENTRSLKHAVLFSKIVPGTREQASALWVDDFVKNIYSRKKQSKIVPQPLPKPGEFSPHTPQYKLEVYKDGELRSQSLLPRKKYYIAKIEESKLSHFEESFDEFQNEKNVSLGLFIPRLPVNPRQAEFLPGMKVYKAFTPEMFDSVMSKLLNERKSILRRSMPSKGGSRFVGPTAKSKVGKSLVNFKEDVEVIDKSQGHMPKDAEIVADLNLGLMYGPCRVNQVLGGGHLLLQWHLDEQYPGLAEKNCQLFVSDVADLHSQFWVDNLNCFYPDRKLEKTNVDKGLDAWDADSTEDYNWDPFPGATEINTNKSICVRSKDSPNFDGVRGEKGFNDGVHIFHLDIKTGNLQGFQFGVCTNETDFEGYRKSFLGKDTHSWVYDVSLKQALHRGISTAVPDNGMTLLQHAYNEGDTAKMIELLNLGADINAVTTSGMTLLQQASSEGDTAKVIELLNLGADINAATTTGLTALHLACYKHQTEVLELLLEKGVDINKVTKRKNTALHISSIGGYDDMVERLVEYGADLNLQTKNKDYTALHIAAQENYVKIVEILVQNGADKDIETDDGHTALDEALQRNHEKVATLLAGSKDTSHRKMETTATKTVEDFTVEKDAQPKKPLSVTVVMKLNLCNPSWPSLTLHFPKLDDFACTAFEGPCLKTDKELYPCVGFSPSSSSVKCTIKLAYSGSTDTDEISERMDQWERIGIFQPSVNGLYEHIPGPSLFPAEKGILNVLSTDISLEVKKTHNKYAMDNLSQTVCASSQSCRNRILLTAQQREMEELHNFPLLERVEFVDFLPPSVFVPLPKVLDLDTLMYPSLEMLLDVKNLCLHFLCKPTDTRFEDLHNENHIMHFVDRPGDQPVQTLPDDLCFGVCTMAWAYLTTKKILLPKYDHLVDESVAKSRPRSQIEHFLQNYLRVLSSLTMANFKHRSCVIQDFEGKMTMHRQERFEEDFELIGKHASNDVKSRLSSSNADMKVPESWLCNSHQYDMITSQGSLGVQHVDTSMIVNDGVLNLEPYRPYNELITAIRLTTNMEQLQEIPPEFQEMFPNLRILTLNEGNILRKLPASIGKLKKLQVLSFTTEEDILTANLPEDIGECKELQELRLPRAYMTRFPESLPCNKKLKVLVVNSNSIRQLPHNFGALRKLEELNLSSNPLASLPEDTGRLKNLTALHLSGLGFMPTKVLYREKETYEQWFQNQEKDIVKVLTMDRIRELYSSCKTLEDGINVTDLHKVNAHLFYEAPRLGLDYVDGDEDGGIPEPIFQLENLETLDLTHQAIRFVAPQVKQLRKLEKLILSQNMLLESLPGSLGSMKKLRTIGLRHCPSMKTPPAEIIGRGVPAITAFLRRLSGGTTENWRTKLMLVGLGGAGKTSLLRALMSPTHKTVGTAASEITDGIDIKPWTVKDQRGKSITFNTWDFAGQDVYYNTHQFFLSGRAVYVLLWTCRLGFEHAGLDFWLSSIQCHAPKAPIFVVGTHCDQVSKPEISQEMLMKKYPQIKGFHFVSSIKGTGILKLEKQLIEVTKMESYMGESVPTVYLSLENKILQLRKEKNVIAWADVQQLAVDCGIFNIDDIKRAVIFLHDLGTVQYFDNDFLRDHVVINPQWIVDVMACVVSVKNSPIQDGKFLHSSIEKVWKDYPTDLHEWLLRLTEEFDLTFPIPSQPINLVPCLLPQTEPQFEWPEVAEGERETMMLYRFTYLPAGLFNRTQVRLFQFSDGKDIWKRGSLLRKNGHLALIKQLSDKEMLLRVQGPRPENVLLLIHEVIESLVMESFSGVDFDFLVPCPDCIKKTGSNLPEKALFESSLIKEAVDWNTPFLQCRLHFHTVSMSVLQASLPSQQDNEIDVHLSQSMRALEDLRSSCTTDVFVHYCEEDLPRDPAKAIHPAMVVQDLERAGFSCWYRDNLSSVDIQDVTLGLQNSKMMVVFMSSNYEKQRQCCDLFKYAKHTLNKPYQVVALGDNMDWTKTNMGGMEIGSHHVFVNMRQKERYPTKIAELENHVKNKLDSLKQTSAYPRCFISYAWSNSHDAVKLGSKQIPGALGWEKSDPRYIKQQLEAHGISCWMDIEQTGKGGLFEDISKGIRHADVMIACVSTEYTKSKNCMMELRFAECSLEKPIIAVNVGTTDDWRFSEVLMLLNRAKTQVIHMQSPNEDGLKKIISLAKEYVSNPVSKSEEPKKPVKEPMRLTEVLFHEEYELAQRKLLRHVSMLAAMMDTTPYPRLFALDIKEKPIKYERPGSARSVAHDTAEQRHHIHKRESKITPQVEDYDSSWADSSLVVKLFCEYDGGCHTVEDGLDITEDLHSSEKEDLVKSWADYLGRVYSLLKHSAVSLNLLNMEQGKHLQKFIKHCMSESDGNFSDAYIKMRDKIIATDKARIMGKLDRCHLPTGKIQWLCEEHQKGHRITVLSSDVDVGAGYGESHLVTNDDQMIKQKIEELAHLAEPYIKNRKSEQPRRIASDKSETDSSDVQSQKSAATPADTVLSPVQSETSDMVSAKPKPKPRKSLLGSAERPTSANTKAKMKAGAQAVQSPDSQQRNTSSKACVIL